MRAIIIALVVTVLVSMATAEAGIIEDVFGFFSELFSNEKQDIGNSTTETQPTQTIIGSFSIPTVDYIIDENYPIEKYNENCFKTMIMDKEKLDKLTKTEEDKDKLKEDKVKYSKNGVVEYINFTKENIICHNLEKGVYKWGYNSSQVVVGDLDVGVFNQTYYTEYLTKNPNLYSGLLIDYENFGAGVFSSTDWNDGGADCTFVSNPKFCSAYSISLTDDDGSGRIWGEFDFDSYKEVELTFSFNINSGVDDDECLTLMCDGTIVDSFGSGGTSCSNTYPESTWLNINVSILNGTHCTFGSATNITFISNSSDAGEYFFVDCIGMVVEPYNGTYTSQVFALNNSFDINTVNLTTNAYVCDGCNLSASVREFILLDKDVVGLWMESAEGTNYKNYGSLGSALDMTMPEAGKYGWVYETYNGSYGTSGSYSFSGSPNPGFRYLDSGKVSNLSTFMMCSWNNLTGGYWFWRGDNDIKLSALGGTYDYLVVKGLSTTEWAWVRINGKPQWTGNWTFKCYGYNGSNFVGYQDGTFAVGPVTNGTITWNQEHHIGLYASGDIAMVFLINGTKDEIWLDEVYNFTRMSWQPYKDYQPIPNGVSTNNYSTVQNPSFSQFKFDFITTGTDTPIVYGFNATFWNYTAGEAVADSTPPYIVDVSNYSNTNVSLGFNITLSELANISSGIYGTCPSHSDIGTFSNSTYSTFFRFNFSGLTNNTNYCFNITDFADDSNNHNTTGYNFTFTTAQNAISAVADLCSLPTTGSNWTLTTVCNFTNINTTVDILRFNITSKINCKNCNITANKMVANVTAEWSFLNFSASSSDYYIRIKG